MLLISLFIGELIFLFFLSQQLTKTLSSLFHKVTRNEIVTIHLLSILFMPGVIIHELAHALTASVLFVPVGEIEFFPKITEHGVKLGSVQIAKTDPIRRALIGFAPVMVGVSLIFLMLYYAASPGFLPQTSEIVKYLLVFFVLFELANTMFSSRKDVEGTIELLLALGILALIGFFVGFRIPQNVFDVFNDPSFVLLLQQACLFLGAPIVVDILLLALLRFIHKN